jgi:hypothetical protein
VDERARAGPDIMSDLARTFFSISQWEAASNPALPDDHPVLPYTGHGSVLTGCLQAVAFVQLLGAHGRGGAGRCRCCG